MVRAAAAGRGIDRAEIFAIFENAPLRRQCTFAGIADTSHAEVGGGEDDGRHVLQMTLKKLVSTLLMSEIIEDEMVGGGKIVYSLRSAA